MPELPEVETSCRGIAPHLVGQIISGVTIRQPKLRWPIPSDLPELLSGQKITSITRRAKYLFITTDIGTLILHLGMSGSLRVLDAETPAEKHDHFDLLIGNGKRLRLRDPRRFGAVLWGGPHPERHPLIAHLGPEPLDEAFSGELLYQVGHTRRLPIKNLIMDAKVVVGVGNIYASESLFLAGIHPNRACHRLSKARYLQLTNTIKQVLTKAIELGGTTLKDFQQSDGKPGYFAQQLNVYGRTGEACPICDNPISQCKIGQRSSFFCGHCQR
ncbi:MAG: bifunctional DNA-formamidopyrimidine glycosylase/DNA-(apurinic or apyrimidinic site) lyase [Candidatus Polarisedimenticolaceae bacterium]|nr:bifunctional DNA-formamidopyrimidine glycosylase/DNA-(apurinic or apyrimidinic site) lyase [Candidatus Polarisedimenticolaceae bacterium]